MHHAGRNRDHSCMENFHGDDIYPHNMNKHSCTYQSLPEHQVSKLCEYLTKRHIKSYQHMEGLSAFSNYVKTTLNLGSSRKEVDWGGNIDPIYTSSRSMLMEVDWGGKLRVNHIHECMTCKSDWGAHETHQNEHSTTRVHWEIRTQSYILWMNTASLKLIGEPMIQVTCFTLCILILMQSQKISSPKSCGENYHKRHLPPLS